MKHYTDHISTQLPLLFRHKTLPGHTPELRLYELVSLQHHQGEQ